MSRPEIVSRAERLGAQKALLDPLELGVFVASVYLVMGVARQTGPLPRQHQPLPGAHRPRVHGQPRIAGPELNSSCDLHP